MRHILTNTAAGVRKAGSQLALRRLNRANRRSPHESLVGDCPVVVSLTTYGVRSRNVRLTIESIGRGHVRPQRLVLWVDNSAVFDDLRVRLADQIERGLELRMSRNFGPHTKYYPMLDEFDEDEVALVTADDDILYPKTWLKRLWRAHVARPDMVNCYRAHLITLSEDLTLAPYHRWTRSIGRPAVTSTSPRVFATGVSGVVYPAEMVRTLRRRGTEFELVTPKADDVWLHYIAVEEGIRVRQIGLFPRHFPLVPESQTERLMDHNNAGHGNDTQIAATYSPLALSRILRDNYTDVISTTSA